MKVFHIPAQTSLTSLPRYQRFYSFTYQPNTGKLASSSNQIQINPKATKIQPKNQPQNQPKFIKTLNSFTNNEQLGATLVYVTVLIKTHYDLNAAFISSNQQHSEAHSISILQAVNFCYLCKGISLPIENKLHNIIRTIQE